MVSSRNLQKYGDAITLKNSSIRMNIKQSIFRYSAKKIFYESTQQIMIQKGFFSAYENLIAYLFKLPLMS